MIYDPLPDYFDPQPAPIPQPSRWRFIIAAVCWIGALAVCLALVVRQLP